MEKLGALGWDIFKTQRNNDITTLRSNKWRPLVNEDTSGATYGMSKEPSPISQNSKKTANSPNSPIYAAHSGDPWRMLLLRTVVMWLFRCVLKISPPKAPTFFIGSRYTNSAEYHLQTQFPITN